MTFDDAIFFGWLALLLFLAGLWAGIRLSNRRCARRRCVWRG